MNIIKRVASKVSGALWHVRFSLGLPYQKALGSHHNRILMYHGVSDVQNPYNQRHCYLSDFERQIAYLSKNANIITLADFFQEKFVKGKPNIAITFDDGYLNNLELAAPVLQKHNTPATVFVTGLATTEYPFIWADFLQIVSSVRTQDFILDGEEYQVVNRQVLRFRDNKNLLNIIKEEKPGYEFKTQVYETLSADFAKIKERSTRFWQLMSTHQIRVLAGMEGITIGSHGFFHNCLGKISLSEAIAEVESSKNYLENIIQKPIHSIGYPDGSYSQELVEEVARLGIPYQLATEKLLFSADVQNPFLRSRSGIYQTGLWSRQLVFAD